ncbi:hypothetical protein Ae201684P_021626 [Aphanomyces euteiches]|nr:hypothetical protein Ae201684P_021626 [Aphanomyces euteiches]
MVRSSSSFCGCALFIVVALVPVRTTDLTTEILDFSHQDLWDLFITDKATTTAWFEQSNHELNHSAGHTN